MEVSHSMGTWGARGTCGDWQRMMGDLPKVNFEQSVVASKKDLVEVSKETDRRHEKG